MKTIQSKILLVVISALVVITAVVSAISVTITHEVMHKDADRILNNVSQKEAAQINDMLNDFVKASAIMEHYAEQELEDAVYLMSRDSCAEYVYKIRNFFDEVALQTAGTTSYYLCLNPELTEFTSGFYKRFNEDGTIYGTSSEDFSKLSLFTDEELEKYSSFNGAEVSMWLEPHPSRFSGETVISYITLLYRGETFVGILGFNMNFDYLIERVNGIKVYEHGEALLVSQDGQSCYNTSIKTEFEDEYAEATDFLKNGMRLELRVPYKDIQGGIRPMLTKITNAFLIVLGVAILYTIWVTHRIVTPLKNLTAEARKITTGNTPDVNLVVETRDEIGVLSRVLNETYGRIREYSSYINALAYRDSLTGIKNTTAYAEAIEELNKEINLGTPSFGVIVADINNLKKTNDTYGHDVGNELIVHSAKILVDTFKTSAIFRIGGDEFAVVLKGKDLERYRALVEKMDEAYSKAYILVNDENISVSIARGVAIFDPAIDRVYTDVFAKADRAMYLNKESMKSVL